MYNKKYVNNKSLLQFKKKIYLLFINFIKTIIIIIISKKTKMLTKNYFYYIGIII